MAVDSGGEAELAGVEAVTLVALVVAAMLGLLRWKPARIVDGSY